MGSLVARRSLCRSGGSSVRRGGSSGRTDGSSGRRRLRPLRRRASASDVTARCRRASGGRGPGLGGGAPVAFALVRGFRMRMAPSRRYRWGAAVARCTSIPCGRRRCLTWSRACARALWPQFAMLRRVALSDPVVLPSYPKAANHSVSTPSASFIRMGSMKKSAGLAMGCRFEVASQPSRLTTTGRTTSFQCSCRGGAITCVLTVA